MSLIQQRRDDLQRLGTVLLDHRFDHGPYTFLRNRAQQRFEIFVANRVATERNNLIQQAEPVTHAAFAGPRQSHQAAVFDGQPVLIGDMPQPLHNLGFGDPAKIVVLTA